MSEATAAAMPDLEKVRFTVSGGVAICTLNRPGAYNALDLSMARELRAVAYAVEADRNIRVLVINGAGRGFCAGGDVAAVAAGLDRVDEMAREFLAEYRPFLIALRRMDQAVITSVHGVAAGAGLALAMMGDLCIAETGAVFVPAYAPLGVTPDCGATIGVVDAVGPKRALQLFLLEDRLSAAEAASFGLVNRVVSPEKLTGDTMAIAARLASLETKCAAGTKHLVRQASSTRIERQLADEEDSVVECMKTSAYRAALERLLSSRSRQPGGKAI